MINEVWTITFIGGLIYYFLSRNPKAVEAAPKIVAPAFVETAPEKPIEEQVFEDKPSVILEASPEPETEKAEDEDIDRDYPEDDAEEVDQGLDFYDDEYKELIMTSRQNPEDDARNANPFIGFWLSSPANATGRLRVSAMYEDGPAYQCGIRLGQYVIAVGDREPKTLEEMSAAVNATCYVGRFTTMRLMNPATNTEYTTMLWIMTIDKRFSTSPLFYDTDKHRVIEETKSRGSSPYTRDSTRDSRAVSAIR